MDVLGFVDIPIWLILLGVVSVTMYIYTTAKYDYWKKRGVPGPSPFPFIGTSASLFRKGLIVADSEGVEKYGKVFGEFEGRKPALMVTDVSMLKQILVKEFPCFTNRKGSGVKEYPIRSAINRIENEHWKHVRNILTPTFSSGKLKGMTKEVNRCAENMRNHLMLKAESCQDVIIKDYSGAFTMDVIASTAFGIQLDAQADKNNPFVTHAKSVFDFRLTNPLIILLVLFPFAYPLIKALGFTFLKKKDVNFFVDIIDQAIEERKAPRETGRTLDFLQLMINAAETANETGPKENDMEETGTTKSGDQPEQTTKGKGLNHEEIVAQALVFFLAGYETTATTISFLTYCLATNLEVQEKLTEEIDAVCGEKDRVEYDMLNKMPYLDMCINETLRMYPPAVRLNRMCQQDVQIGDYLIERGVSVNIPVFYLHHNPEVWPEPDMFMPERFTPEEKNARDPYNFLPFGLGPRNCIGMRLALMEVKIAVVHILKNFRLVPCDKTDIPMVLGKPLLLKPKNPITLKLELRER